MKENPTIPTSATSARELAYRHADGVHVTLLWLPITNHLIVEVYDERHGEMFDVDAPADRALEAFWHPYAYAAFTGVTFGVPAREPVGA
jgi:hypothetical protein